MRIDSPLMTNAIGTGSFSGSFTGAITAESFNSPGLGLISGSSQITISSTTGYTSFSSSLAADIAANTLAISNLDNTYTTDVQLNASSSALISGYTTADSNLSSSLATAIKSEYQAADTSLSSSLASAIATNTAKVGYTDTLVKTKLNTENVVSGSSQILNLVSIDEDNMSSNSDTKLPTQQSVKNYVDTKVSALVDSAPGALDTLNELAAALGDDANFATTISNTIAGKVSQSLEIISGNGLTGGGNLTTNRTLAVGAGDGISVSADAVAVDATVLRTTGDFVVSGSSQITISQTTGYTSFSSSFASGIASNLSAIQSNDSDITALQTASGSFSTRVTNNETSISSLTTASGSFSTRVTSLESTLTDLNNTYTTDAELNASSSALISAYQGADTALSSSIVATIASIDKAVPAITSNGTTPSLNTGISAAEVRSLIDVDQAGTDNSTNVTLAGSYDYITISGQVITRNQVDASTDISNLNTSNVSEVTNLYYTDTRVKTKLNTEGVISGSSQVFFSGISGKPTLVSGSAQINHDSTTGFVANEHIDHTEVSITAGNGLTGGGTIAATRTLNVGAGDGISVTADAVAVDATVLRTTGDSIVSSSIQIDSLSTTNSVAIYDNGGTPALKTGITAAEIRTLIDVDQAGTDNSTDQNLFSTIAVAGQSSVIADTTSDTLTLAAGSNVTITTNATTDTVTIASSHPTVTAASSVNNSGRTFIQDITLDSNGHVTGITSATDADTYVGTVTSIAVSGSNGLTGNGTVTTSGAINIQHADTSTQTSVNNSGRTFIQDITLDGFGHITAITSATDADTYTGTVTSVGGTGTVNGLTLTGTVTTTGNLTLGGTLAINNADWSGTDLSLANGGTGASLSDPNADRILFWDDSAGAVTWLAPGTGISISGTSLAIGQDVATSANVTFGSVAVTNNVTISGNLTVLGDAVEIQVGSLNIEDKNITIASGAADSAAADGAGITIAGAGKSLTWDHANSRFDFSDDLNVQGNISLTGTVDGRDLATDGSKLDGIAAGAEVNQNAFSNVAVSGQTTVAADAKTDTLTLAAGTNVSITTNATTDTITINSTDQYTGTVTSVGGTGTVNGLSLSGTVTSTGNLTLGGTLAISNADWSGTDLSLANGGTGASLSDPNADSILFWDDSAGAVTWLTPSTGISISGTSISNSGVTSNVAGTGISVSGATGAVTITNTSPNATHTGDVTGATALTIANNAVTNAKAADMAVSTIKGRATAGTGDPEDLTATQVRTILNVEDGANNYSLPTASSTVLGGIKIEDDTVQSVAANAVSATASRTYGIQVNASGQAVVNVPWVDTNTTYAVATSTVPGLVEVFSDTDQAVAANAVTATAGRTYGIQLNADNQAVVNVPWTDTTYTRASFINQDVNTTDNVHFEGLMVGQTTGATANTIRCIGDVVAYYSSDAQFKDNVQTLEGSLDKIKQIRGVRFDWNDKQDVYTGHDIGVIAQEVEAVLPELVHHREYNDSKAVDYVKLTAVLVEAVKELSAKVAELESKL